VNYITIISAATIADIEMMRADAPEAPLFAPGALLALMVPVLMYPALQKSLLVRIWKKGLEGCAVALRVNPENERVFEPAGMVQPVAVPEQLTVRVQTESGVVI